MKLLSSLVVASTVLASVVNGAVTAVHGRRHHELAKRVAGDVSTHQRRGPNARFSWYDTETGNAGACGQFISNSQFAVAVNAAEFNQGICFQTITVSYNGRSAQATVMDMCPGCPPNGLDLSRGLFAHLTDLGAGIIYGDWSFGGGGGPPPPPPPPVEAPWVPPPPVETPWVPPPPVETPWVPPPPPVVPTPQPAPPSPTPAPPPPPPSSSVPAPAAPSSSAAAALVAGGPVANAGLAPSGSGAAAAPTPSGSNIADLYEAFVTYGDVIVQGHFAQE